MAYKLKAAEPLGVGVRRIAVEQIDKALAEIDTAADRDQVVHDVRKRCKKLRAALRAVRDGLGAVYARENRELGELSRRLAAFRDAKVVVGTHDGLVGHFGDVLDTDALAGVRRRLAGSAADDGEALDAAALERGLETFRAGLVEARERVPGWAVAGRADAVLGDGLKHTYKRGRRGFRRAAVTGAAEDFHEWRKRVKYHWYHARLVEALVSEPIAWRAEQAEQLADVLGDAHDLAVYAHELDAIAPGCNATAIETLRALAVWRREQLQGRALELGRQLFAAKPGAFVAAIAAPSETEPLRDTG